MVIFTVCLMVFEGFNSGFDTFLMFLCCFSGVFLNLFVLFGNIFFWASGRQIQDEGCELFLDACNHLNTYVGPRQKPLK